MLNESNTNSVMGGHMDKRKQFRKLQWLRKTPREQIQKELEEYGEIYIIPIDGIPWKLTLAGLS